MGALSHQKKPMLTRCTTVLEMVKSREEMLEELRDIIERYTKKPDDLVSASLL